MRVRINEPDLVPELLALLGGRIACVTSVDGLEVEACLVGSYVDGGESELTPLVRAWQRRHPEIEVELLP
jgi:hypothetical protein